ncbi:GreA/GreB family elongation factor [Polaribacter sp. IC073]|uniref:GreA/GreB family elongation factor n=1 Tax=Polaribacter sp. IC073 TaxID=2508540 RepID=UPI0011BFB8C4|nr:GreA/GreB family elongation factor [Polaribacter sp. IC073]TXD49440.1 transcription elongation factor GreA [Polaribacter sp. IC073]
MSRGFVKEDDQEEIPFVPPRAHLPFGVDNYITANGLKELKEEQKILIEEQKTLISQSNEINRVQINFLSSKLSLLEDRINSAKIINLKSQPQSEIHFGATITLFKFEENCECQYQIVGVDEANVSKNKISFLSPLAKVLRSKKIGDVITLKTPKGSRDMKINSIQY